MKKIVIGIIVLAIAAFLIDKFFFPQNRTRQRPAKTGGAEYQ